MVLLTFSNSCIRQVGFEFLFFFHEFVQDGKQGLLVVMLPNR